MKINFKPKLTRFQVVAVSIMFLLMGVLVFVVYTLFVLSAFSVLLVIGLSMVLVFIIAFSLKEAADKVIVKIKPVFEPGDNQAVRAWALKQFKFMLLLLGCGFFSSVMLAFFGGILVKTGAFVQKKDFIDLILGYFGFIVFILGCYFIFMLIKEIRFVFQKKEVFIDKIIEQGRG
ncbi:MAG: hypothetical protein WDL87_04080 [Candidatus Omnitrophota bacterium]|jgi:hypothetical protein